MATRLDRIAMACVAILGFFSLFIFAALLLPSAPPSLAFNCLAQHITNPIMWLVEGQAVTGISEVQTPNGAALAGNFFMNRNTYMWSMIPTGYQGIVASTLNFKSYTGANGENLTLRSTPKPQLATYSAVLLDEENWSTTPYFEQTNTSTYYSIGANSANANGLILIATPGTDLAISFNHSSQQYKWFEYYGIPYNAAKYATIYDIQAQPIQQYLGQYVSNITIETSQICAANSNEIIVAGLSTDRVPAGLSANDAATVIYNAFVVSNNLVSGYWLNVVGNEPNNETIAADFLNILQSHGYK